MAEPESPSPIRKQVEIPMPSSVLSIAVNPGATLAYAACQDGGVYEVDLGRKDHELVGRHESYASSIMRLDEGRTLISAGYDGQLLWHDLGTRKLLRTRQAHQFWCWDADLSPDQNWVASATGRYEAGGPRYEPAPEVEPCVRLFDSRTGDLKHSLPHLPPVQAVAFSSDSRHVAAGNLMGDIRVWEVATGREVSRWNTPDLTSWGVIKSHHYLGGVFAMMFDPGGEDLFLCGMGPMVDPMAGNGVQRWQRFEWRTGKRKDQTHDGESGQGLMEAITFHPHGKWFVMAGRLFQGQWNLALFDVLTGRKLHSVDAKHRITEIRFSEDGSRMVLAKARQQEKKKDGKWPGYGTIEVWDVGTIPISG